MSNHLTPQEEGHLLSALAETQKRLAHALLNPGAAAAIDLKTLRDRVARLSRELNGGQHAQG